MIVPTDDRSIVVFDGVCHFCNAAVLFIIKRDPEGRFAFTPMQSELAQELLAEYDVGSSGVDTFLLVKDGRPYVFSDAALEIARDLTGCWYLFNVFRIIPSAILNYLYQMFARRRYRLFGKRDSCMVPSDDVKSRFIGV